MSGRTDWKEIFGNPEQGFVNRVHATLDGLTEAGTSRCTPQHFRRRRLLDVYKRQFLIYAVAEVFKFQPNEYDNNKLLYVWFLLCLPMAADLSLIHI